jgi:hypothetical protein
LTAPKLQEAWQAGSFAAGVGFANNREGRCGWLWFH